jgi:predicted aspartyl protease
VPETKNRHILTAQTGYPCDAKRAILFFLMVCRVIFSGNDNVIAGSTEFSIIHTIYFKTTGGSSSDGALPDAVTIPLKRAGRLLLMEARIDNETGNFIFDTGSSKLVLNNTYFRKYLTTDAGTRGGITGNVSGVRQTRVNLIQISDLSYRNVTADMADLGHIENRRNVKILGLFGFSLLKDMEIVIDVNHNELHLYRLGKDGTRISRKDKEFEADITQKIIVYQDIVFVNPRIGGKLLSFCLDTGAESNVLNSASPRKVISTVTITRRSGLVGAGSSQSDVLFCNLNDFMIGDKQIPLMQAILTNLEDMSAAYGFSVDGMLGYDFFEKGEICINLVTREIKICFQKTEKS